MVRFRPPGSKTWYNVSGDAGARAATAREVDKSKPKTVPMPRSGTGVTREEAIRQAARYQYGSSSPQATATIQPISTQPKIPEVTPGVVVGNIGVMIAHTELPTTPHNSQITDQHNVFGSTAPSPLEVSTISEQLSSRQKSISAQNVELISSGSKIERALAQEYMYRQRLENAPIQDGVFVGTPQQYKKYEKDYEKHSNIVASIQSQSTEYEGLYNTQLADIEMAKQLETAKERSKMGGLRGVEMDISDKLPTFDDLVDFTVEQVEKSPIATKAFIGAAYATDFNPSTKLKKESIGQLGEGIYTFGSEHPVQTVGIAVTAPLVMGAIGLGVAAGAAVLPVSAATIESGVGAAFIGSMAFDEYQHLTQPVFTGGTEMFDIPTTRKPTIPEMSYRYGESLVPLSAFIIGAGAPKAIRNIDVPYSFSMKSKLPEGLMLKGEINIPTPRAVESTALTPKGEFVDVVKFEPKQETPFYIGKQSDGIADFYYKVPKGQEGKVLSSYTGELSTIVTSKGKMLQLTEAAKREEPGAVFDLLTGKAGKKSFKDMLPFEINKKVKLEPIDLSFVEVSAKPLITDYTNTFDMGAPSTPKTKSPNLLESRRRYLDVGTTVKPKDATEIFMRKDVHELPYTREIQYSIKQESALMGRQLTKSERGMVRDDAIKDFEMFDFNIQPPVKSSVPKYKEVQMRGGHVQIMKPQVKTSLKEPETIRTVNLETDLFFGQNVPQVVKPKAKTKQKSKSKFEYKEKKVEPVFDVGTKSKSKTKARIVPVFSQFEAPTPKQTTKNIITPFNANMFKMGQLPKTTPKQRAHTTTSSIFKASAITKTQSKTTIPKTSYVDIFEFPKIELPPTAKISLKEKKSRGKKKRKGSKTEFWTFTNPIKSAKDML